MKKDERSQQNYERSAYYTLLFSIFLNITAMTVTIIIEKGPGLAFFSIVTIYVLQMFFWIIMNAFLMKFTLQPIQAFYLGGIILIPLIGLFIFLQTDQILFIIASFFIASCFARLFITSKKKTY